VSSRTPAVPLPAAARALSPAALEAALHGAAPATLVAAQEVTAGPMSEDTGGAGLAPGRSDPGCAARLEAPPARALRGQLLAGEGVAQLLLFRVGRELFGVGLGCVEEAIELEAVSPVAGMPNGMLGVIQVRDRLLPLYSPAGALGIAPGAPAVAKLRQVEPAPLNGGLGILSYVGDQPFGALTLETDGRQIHGLRLVVNPDKLTRLR